MGKYLILSSGVLVYVDRQRPPLLYASSDAVTLDEGIIAALSLSPS